VLVPDSIPRVCSARSNVCGGIISIIVRVDCLHPEEPPNWLGGAVSANRWLSLFYEALLRDPALEKYDRVGAPALLLRQTCDVRPGVIRAILGRKIDFSSRTPPRERKGETGGGRSPSRTPLRPNSLLTGKNTGSYRRLLEPW
jgi:hypothetical protein